MPQIETKQFGKITKLHTEYASLSSIKAHVLLW